VENDSCDIVGVAGCTTWIAHLSRFVENDFSGIVEAARNYPLELPKSCGRWKPIIASCGLYKVPLLEKAVMAQICG